jgi:uncharacterized protein YhaN
MKNDDCKQIEELLVDFTDGVLDESDEKLVKRHLDGCQDCRQTVKALEESLSMAQVIWDDNLDKPATKRHRHTLRYIQIAAYKEQTSGKPHKLLKYAGVMLSAAAMIFLAVMLLSTADDNKGQPVEYQAKILTAKISLPANVPTIAKLNCIFQKGDIEDVDAFCEKAARRTGPRPEKLTVRQLIKEFENDSNKTKGNNNENRSYNNTDNINNAA